jgi:hypothetical protein
LSQPIPSASPTSASDGSRIIHGRVVKPHDNARKRHWRDSPKAVQKYPVQPRILQVVELGCEIPFTSIPAVVEEGFRAEQQRLAHRKPKMMEHYQVARNCLLACLGDPLCDLLLLLVLTLSSSSVTPSVPARSRVFEPGPRKMESGRFAANLVTRMLWFLRPDAFPWKEDDGQVLRVPEMTKEIGGREWITGCCGRWAG